MTREELHELVDIVMDAREKHRIQIHIAASWVNVFGKGIDIYNYDYPTFSDFTQAVKDYIKSLGYVLRV